MQAPDWLDKNYPKKKRSEVNEIYLNEPSLEGELDLKDFTYWNNDYKRGVKVYISLSVDETKLTFKNQGGNVEIIKLINVQAWLTKNYPQNGVCQRETDDKLSWDKSSEGWNNQGKTREKITKLNIGSQNLEGDLDLLDFINLEWLECHGNKLTTLNLSNCFRLEKIYCSNNLLTDIILPETNLFMPGAWPQELKELYLNSNNFPIQDLSFLTLYTNLEELRLGNWNQQKIDQNIYNCFTGSLDYLSGMEKLRKLSIDNTDINELNIEQLPKNLKEIKYSTELRPNCQLTTIIPLLDKYFGKFNRCLKCLLANTSKDWCQPCAEREWKQLTGQELIEKFIEKLEKRPVGRWGNKTKLQWISYEQIH